MTCPKWKSRHKFTKQHFCYVLYTGTGLKSRVGTSAHWKPSALVWFINPGMSPEGSDDYRRLPSRFVGDHERICNLGKMMFLERQEHLNIVSMIFLMASGRPSSTSSAGVPLQAHPEPPTCSCFIPLSMAVGFYLLLAFLKLPVTEANL